MRLPRRCNRWRLGGLANLLIGFVFEYRDDDELFTDRIEDQFEAAHVTAVLTVGTRACFSVVMSNGYAARRAAPRHAAEHDAKPDSKQYRMREYLNVAKRYAVHLNQFNGQEPVACLRRREHRSPPW
jgi:hypothetical protein